MSEWSPITEGELWDKINKAWLEMSLPQRRLWELIKIDPIKWKETSYGKMGGGFWVVALYGSSVIWYNDIEEGFNLSAWSSFGLIDDYWCNQDELQWTIQRVVNQWTQEAPHTGNTSAPEN